MLEINIELSEKSIDEAIKKIREYEQSLALKNERFVNQLCEEGIPEIENSFSNIYTDDPNLDTTHINDIRINGFQNLTVGELETTASEITFIEFGTGVSYNGQAGGSPHPKGKEMGMTIGGYGQGHGKRSSWTYESPNGEFVRTKGIKAAMPMYNASTAMRRKIISVARNVFGRK